MRRLHFLLFRGLSEWVSRLSFPTHDRQILKQIFMECLLAY